MRKMKTKTKSIAYLYVAKHFLKCKKYLTLSTILLTSKNTKSFGNVAKFGKEETVEKCP